MSKLPAILINYNFTPDWLKDYPNLEVTIFDRSDDGIERNLTTFGKVYKTQNMGDVDADKIGYLIENYDDLPEYFLWGKTNLFKFISEEEWQKVQKNKEFTPLLTQNHKTYSDGMGVVCKYEGNMYKERNDSWYFNAGLHSNGHFVNWSEWAQEFSLPQERYIPFAPGGNYILTKEKVHRYSRDFYQRMRDMLVYAQHPVEAHLAERSYLYLWL